MDGNNKVLYHRPIQWVYDHLLPLCSYTAITLLYTWPTAAHFTTHIPGAGDAPWFLWQFWWFKYALFDLHQLPYQTGMIFYPLTDVPVMAQTPVNEILMVPLLLGANVILFYNLLFVLTYTLSGYFTYLLGRGLGCRRDIAFVGGIFFAFCAYRGMRGIGHMSLLTTQWMPLALLLAIQCWRSPSRQRGLALGTVTALVALSSPYYIGIFLLPTVGIGLLYLAITKWPRVWRPALWQAAAVATVVVALSVVPAYLHYLFLEADLYAVNDVLAAGAAANAADLLSWLLPSGLNAVWGKLTGPIYADFSTPNLMETTLFVGYLPLLLLVASFVLPGNRGGRRFWQLLALGSIILSLGPTLHVQGQPLFHGLPYGWLLLVPGFDSFRIPSRAGVTAALALSVVAMLLLQAFSKRWSSRRQQTWGWRLGLGGMSLLYLINVSPFFPHPLTDATVPAIYQEVATLDEGAALLELPGGEYFNNGYNHFAAAGLWMSYQRAHQRPVVSGYLGRRPARLHEPERTLPFVRRFFSDGPQQTAVDVPDLTLLPDPYWPQDIYGAAELLTREGIGAVLLHCALPETQHFCLAAAPLLSQALGMASALSPADGATHRLHPVNAPTYQTRRLPQYLTDLPPIYDEAFVAAQTSAHHRSHVLQENTGTIQFTVPYSGTWRIQGVVSGALAQGSDVWVDNEPIPLQPDVYMGYGYRWHIARALAAGTHTIRLQASPSSLAPERDGERATRSCADLCVHNVSIHLLEMGPPPFATAVPLVNRLDERATFLGHQLLVSDNAEVHLAPAAPAPNAVWLMTVWQLDDVLSDRLLTLSGTMPDIFIHFFAADGQRISQANHPLGERYLFDRSRGILYDFVPLPRTAAGTLELSTLHMTLDLWYPETGDYFWQPDGVPDATAAIIDGGLVNRQQRAFGLPTFPVMPTVAAQAVTPTDERGADAPDHIFTLLNAAVTPPVQPVADASPRNPLPQEAPAREETPSYLLTTWQVPYTFRANADLVVVLYVTDALGETRPPIAYQLGGHDLLRDGGGYLIDRIPLPPLRGDPVNLTLHLELWHGATQQQFQITPLDRTQLRAAQPNRITLGTLAALQAGE